MLSDDRQVLARDLSDQDLEPLELARPFLYLRNQIDRHIHRARFAGLFESELPGWGLAPWTADLRKRALDKHPHLAEFSAIRFPEAVMPAFGGQRRIH